MADELFLVKNAKGRYVLVSRNEALSLTARQPTTVSVKPGDADYDRGMELAAGGKGEGVRGDAVLTRTGEGLVIEGGK